MKKLSKKLTSKWSLKEPLYIKKNDKRYARHIKQLKINGFSDSETWALDSVICQFIIPRLIRFKEVNIAYPGNGVTMEMWNAMIDEMIFAFDWSLNHEEDKYYNLTDAEKKKNWKRYDKGMKVFAKWFRHLWW